MCAFVYCRKIGDTEHHQIVVEIHIVYMFHRFCSTEQQILELIGENQFLFEIIEAISWDSLAVHLAVIIYHQQTLH